MFGRAKPTSIEEEILCTLLKRMGKCALMLYFLVITLSQVLMHIQLSIFSGHCSLFKNRTLHCTAPIICVQEGQHLWQKHLLEESRHKNRLIRLQERWKSETSRDIYFKDSIEKRLSLTKSLTEIKI